MKRNLNFALLIFLFCYGVLASQLYIFTLTTDTSIESDLMCFYTFLFWFVRKDSSSEVLRFLTRTILEVLGSSTLSGFVQKPVDRTQIYCKSRLVTFQTKEKLINICVKLKRKAREITEIVISLL